MTNGQNNPNNLPDEDWAMSEPEIPIEKEIEAKPIDEKAASLYAPLDTGDLEGWDIASQDVSSFEDEVPPSPNPPPQQFNEPAVFTPPPNSFELLKPIASPKSKGEDWGMDKSKAQNDGWQMPDPSFRATEGEILTKIRKSSSKSKNVESAESAQAQENLPDIYAPPDTQESITEDFDLSETSEETSEELDFSNAIPAESSISPQMSDKSSAPTNNKKWSFIIWGLLLAGFLIIILIAVVVGLYFYSAKQ